MDTLKEQRQALVTKLEAGEKVGMTTHAKASSFNREDATGIFTISTKGQDRSRDVVEVSGAQVENYLKNPVVLWAHEHHSPPIGKTLELDTSGDTIQALAKFALGVNPRADMVFSLYEGGFLSAASIGFIPEKWTRMLEEDDEGGKVWKGGIHHQVWELLEWSAVPVPDNPEALAHSAKQLTWLAKEAGMMDDLDQAMAQAGIPHMMRATKLVKDHPELLQPDGLMALVKQSTTQALKELGLVTPSAKSDPLDDPAVTLAVESLADDVKNLTKALQGD